ncbi:hypothetical protein ACFQZ4_08485 [Catellatospora coxensis]
MQAVLVPIRFGVYFPEADVQTQFGGRALAALTSFEQAVRGEALPGTAPRPPRGTRSGSPRSASPTPAAAACSRTSTWPSPPGAAPRSSASTGPARPPW